MNSLSDNQARELIRKELKRNFLVEAGAGSGKTSSLISRLVALIVSGEAQVENIAALTFTRKAAAELKERFQLALEEASRSESGVERQRVSDALSTLDRVYIGTIHSFCARLLRERPIEAGITPDFKELEGLEERFLQERAWEEYLLRLRVEGPEKLDMLRILDVSEKDLQEAYHILNMYPDVEWPVIEVPYPDLESVRVELYGLLKKVSEHLPIKEPEGGWDNLQKTIRMARQWRRIFDLEKDFYLFRLLELMDKEIQVTKKRWEKPEIAIQMENLYELFREQTLMPALKSWREYRYKYLMEIIVPAGRYYQELRIKESVVNFQDLLLKTSGLLRDHPEVRGYFQRRYTHLLVDEFQDTDPIQAEIIMYLTGTDLLEKDWTKIVPIPGSLFVVGDPKQSIYRFRRADIDTYFLVKKQIEATGGSALYLTANFRSLPEVVDFVNITFEEMFKQGPPYQAEFVSMEALREDESRLAGLYFFPVDKKKKKEDLVKEDARQIAVWIKKAIDFVPEDFLILVRYKKHMSEYGKALAAYRIPFSIAGDSDLSSSLELKELYYLLQALSDPDDPVPLVATLRGILFGVSDQELYLLRKAGGVFSFLAPLPELSEDFEPIWIKLRQYWKWTKEMPPSTAINRIAEESGILALAIQKDNPGSIIQMIELIRGRERAGQTSFADAVKFFGQLLEEGIEDQLDVEGRSSGVRIMNLHKAKGLEAKVVILANPSKANNHPPRLHVERQGNKAKGYLEINKKKGFQNIALAQPVNWELYKVEEEKYQKAEEQRLLYVAATRARDTLFISTAAQKSAWEGLELYVLEKDFVKLPSGEADEQSVSMEHDRTEFINFEKTRTKRFESIKKSSYIKKTITEISKDSGDTPLREETGKGFSWGTVMHRVLELIIREKKFSVREILVAEGRDESEEDEVIKIIEELRQTDIWERILKAEIKLTEVPFGMFVDDTYLGGIIDLAFLEEDGWVLIDYKSDHIVSEEHLGQLYGYYLPQIASYKEHWQTITGERVKEYGLLFTAIPSYLGEEI